MSSESEPAKVAIEQPPQGNAPIAVLNGSDEPAQSGDEVLKSPGVAVITVPTSAKQDLVPRTCKFSLRCRLCTAFTVFMLIALLIFYFVFVPKPSGKPTQTPPVTKSKLSNATSPEFDNVNAVESRDGNGTETSNGVEEQQQAEVCTGAINITCDEFESTHALLYLHASEDTWDTRRDRCSDDAFLIMPKEIPPPFAQYLLQVPAGTYGLMLIDDKDNDGKLDTNWLGMPTEGCGASNGAAGGPFGGPKWSTAQFEVECDLLSNVQISLWKA